MFIWNFKKECMSARYSGRQADYQGTRIPVELILKLLAQGETYEGILDDYLDLKLEDLDTCVITG